MDNEQYVEDEWPYVLSLMPDNLEELCTSRLALERRREITNASDLLRLCMAYSICDMSLRQTAAWAAATGLADISDVAVLKRLRATPAWLGAVVAEWLYRRGISPGAPVRTLRIVDATTVSAPGSTGIDWRLHLCLDPIERQIRRVELTTAKDGERLDRHPVAAGEVILGDRGYATVAGIAHVCAAGGHVVIRTRWTLPLESPGGRRIDMVSLLETLDRGEIGDWPARMSHKGSAYPLRLIAIRKTDEASEKTLRELRREARKKHGTLKPETVRAARFIAVVTDLSPDEFSCVQILELYRMRWQIELAFKRLKSIVGFNRLRAKDDALSQAYLLAKILGALVIDELSGQALDFFPWGFRLPEPAGEPVADACALC
jgi:hypothetical protein